MLFRILVIALVGLTFTVAGCKQTDTVRSGPECEHCKQKSAPPLAVPPQSNTAKVPAKGVPTAQPTAAAPHSISAPTTTPPQAVLPEKYINRDCRRLKVGETGWVTPWALRVYSDGTLSLDDSYIADDTKSDPRPLKVTRVNSGYIVDVSHVAEQRWRRGFSKGPGVITSLVYNGKSFTALPDELKVVTLVDLKIGESTWVWWSAILVGPDRKLWLELDTETFRTSDYGRVQLRHTAAGYEVDISNARGRSQWTLESKQPTGDSIVPVTQFKD